MIKCTCRVCEISRWIKKRYGVNVAEYWLSDGMDLEADTYFNPSFTAKLKYRLHFNKLFIILKLGVFNG